MNLEEPPLLSKPWRFKALYDNFNEIATEVEIARGAYENLSARENIQEDRITELEVAKGNFNTLLERENVQENRITELEAAKGNFNTLLERENVQENRITELESEIVNGRQGEDNLLNTLRLYCKTADGFTQSIKANGYKLTGLGLGVNPNDAVTLSQVNAMLTLGGDPTNVKLLDLSSDGLEPGQHIKNSENGLIGTQVVPVNDEYQGLAGQNLIVNANNSFTITLPRNPIPNITEIEFIAFTGKVGQNNISIIPFGPDLLEGMNEKIIIRKNQALKFVFIGGLTGWLKIEQSTSGVSVDTPHGFSIWYTAIKRPSVYNILKII